MLSGKKVFIAVLNTGNIRVELAHCLIVLSHDKRYQVKITYHNRKPIEENRNQIAKKFLESGYDYLLMIDSDNPPLKNPLDLVELDKDVIACPTPQWRDGDIFWVVMEKVDGGYKPVPVSRRNGLQKVDAVGTGCILIARRVLEAVKAPFIRKIDEDGMSQLGLDFYFCEKARNKGFKIWAHWDYPCSHFKEINLVEVLNLIK